MATKCVYFQRHPKRSHDAYYDHRARHEAAIDVRVVHSRLHVEDVAVYAQPRHSEDVVAVLRDVLDVHGLHSFVVERPRHFIRPIEVPRGTVAIIVDRPVPFVVVERVEADRREALVAHVLAVVTSVVARATVEVQVVAV